MFKHLTKGDKILICVVLVLSIFSLFMVRNISGKGKYVVISSGGQVVKTYVLGSDLEGRTVKVQGTLGHTIIQFGKNKVRVISSPCQGKDCIKMGWIDNAGEMVVCLPNEISVRIQGDDSTPDIDGGTY